MTLLFVIGLAVFLTWIDWYRRHISSEASHAVWTRENYKKAGKALEQWERNNPYKNASDTEAQRLLQIKAGAYVLMMFANPHFVDEGRFNSMTEDIEYWTP
ncbi:MAG TPA: hypothetical protein VJH55_02970 [Candidatus Paceibacterota bacterium]